ncbi:LacI family DNA-binding transcriptional regulator [Streptomyces malaysiensis]|uniref:LacI family DNA-binding transcriptional regulator n=1 Tax=Streptomyces malaysiensis TaxID=92644 RepID=UPI000BFF26F2|nr:LacI family DNA-binding transcriptional regulator [Streptomyces malaysiensis]ATL88462.1 transcriptional regulator, LacI family [Streptomyces malaysiensis]
MQQKELEAYMAEPGHHEPVGGGAPTLQDVAQAAGVSRQTVSNVLHAPERVRPATRERVVEFISRLGYQPNRQAQALARSASHMIGCRIRPLTPGALTSMHDRFLHALAEAGRAADHHLLLFAAEDESAEIDSVGRLHRGGAADAFVLYDLTADDQRPKALLDMGVPFVAFGRTDKGADTYPWVDVDNVLGTRLAVDHLVNRGHRRIAFLGWPSGRTIGDRRARGWHQAVESHRLASTCGVLDVRSEDSVQAAIQVTFRLLEHSEPPTAIVTATDTLAVGAMQAAQRWGLEVGRDLAVVGFDDTPTAAALELSSIRQPIELVARQVVAALLGTDKVGPGRKLLEPQLVIRSSSARPASPRR